MYQECINYYVCNVRNKKNGELLSQSTQEQRALELNEFCEFVTQSLTAENLDVTLAEYKQSLNGKYLPETLNRRVLHAREFAQTILKGDNIMNDNVINDNVIEANETTNTELDDQHSTDIQQAQTDSTQEAQSLTVNAPEDKQGRKRTGKEKKTAKIMIYVEPSLLADIQDLAYSNRSSMVTLITGILEDYISANQDRLQKFRNL